MHEYGTLHDYRLSNLQVCLILQFLANVQEIGHVLVTVAKFEYFHNHFT